MSLSLLSSLITTEIFCENNFSPDPRFFTEWFMFWIILEGQSAVSVRAKGDVLTDLWIRLGLHNTIWCLHLNVRLKWARCPVRRSRLHLLDMNSGLTINLTVITRILFRVQVNPDTETLRLENIFFKTNPWFRNLDLMFGKIKIWLDQVKIK